MLVWCLVCGCKQSASDTSAVAERLSHRPECQLVFRHTRISNLKVDAHSTASAGLQVSLAVKQSLLASSQLSHSVPAVKLQACSPEALMQRGYSHSKTARCMNKLRVVIEHGQLREVPA